MYFDWFATQSDAVQPGCIAGQMPCDYRDRLLDLGRSTSAVIVPLARNMYTG